MKDTERLVKPSPDSLVPWWVELGEEEVQWEVLGHILFPRREASAQVLLLLLTFTTELILHKDSCVCVCVCVCSVTQLCLTLPSYAL